MNELTSFVAIYREGCRILGHAEESLLTYRELDHLYQFVEAHPAKDKFKEALADERVCITIPYELFPDKRLPPDTETDDGTPVIFACPATDAYVSLLLDEMRLTEGTNLYEVFGSVAVFNRWKLLRLAKVWRLGWEGFAQAYLEPLREKERYLQQFLEGALRAQF